MEVAAGYCFSFPLVYVSVLPFASLTLHNVGTNLPSLQAVELLVPINLPSFVPVVSRGCSLVRFHATASSVGFPLTLTSFRHTLSRAAGRSLRVLEG